MNPRHGTFSYSVTTSGIKIARVRFLATTSTTATATTTTTTTSN